jgi:hypothetical protein
MRDALGTKQMEPAFPIRTDVNVIGAQIVDSKSRRFVLPPQSRTKQANSHIFRLITILLVFFSLGDCLSGTTVVVLRGPNYAILGSDSMVTLVTGGTRTSAKACKIQQVNRVFVSAAGAVGPAFGFDAIEIARRAVNSKATTLIAIANKFEKDAQQPFSAYVRHFRRESPGTFTRYCNSRDCLQIAFATVEKGVPKVSIRAFSVSVKNNLTIVVPTHRMDCPGTCVTGNEQIVLGVNAEAISVFEGTPHFWKIKGIALGMEELIGSEIAAHGDVVGAPISILTLDSQGAHFMPEHQGLCPNPNN